ncbi:unnamed protein product [Microthlaspi erraticum]|uniref:NYN domain-containing protein n=1 Tax=Microthlaspi erraticum TaxID=1685480 RepID=A0A6D2IY48_9BRAS|nr:unnamed protein product [Microthlaspi erraticum]
MDEESVWQTEQFPLTFYKEGETKTCVFWDMNDYPIPRGADPASIYKSIKDAISKQGCDGDLFIQAYVDVHKSRFPEREYSDAGFQVEVFPRDEGGNHARYCSMFADMRLWSFANLTTPSNVILLAKITDDDMAFRLRFMCKKIYGYFCCTDRKLPARSDSSFLTSLFDL